MSKEVNENGKPFVLSSNGLTNFGEVTADSGLPAAPIKLSIGENTKDVKGKNHGYGLLHIEASHGTQIRKAGFHSIEEFVENVAENYDTIREGSLIGKKQTYLLEVSDEHNNTLFVQLSRDGQYWNVNSAGIFREAYSRRKPKVASLPTIGSNPSTETAEVNRDHSMDAVATSGNSSTTSADKVTESSEELQEQEEKFSPTPSGNTGSEEDEHEQFALTRRDEAVSLVNKMEDDAEIAPEIELTISNWDTLFGEEGIVKTPLGEVKMGENQSAKLMRQGRESKLGMIKPTLENPDVIIEASSEAKEGSITERGSSYIFVKAFRKSDGLRYYYFTSVTVSKEGKEVVVSSQEKSRNRLLRLLTDEEIIWRTPKDATTSSAERQGLDYVQPLDAETATKGSGLTPQRISSADKVTESSEEWQEQEEKFSPTPSGNIGSEEETYTLSSETSENGESFYQNNDGNIDLADIPDEVFDKIGKPKALFRLTPSMLKHVFDRHGKEMGLHHADDAIDFVLDVLNNFDHVRQGDKGAIIFSIENGRSRTGRRAVTILLDSQRGEYYGIKTSGYERIEGLHKRPLLWEKGAKETSATGVAPANVTTNEALQGNEPTGSASNHGNDPMGKVTESSEELQEKEDKFTPAPIEDGEDYVDYAARVTAAKAQHDAIKAVENATDTESQRLATDAALEGLKRADVPVEVVSDEQAAVMLGEQKGVELSAKQKRGYCPKKVCKLQSSYICVMNKKSTKNNEAYKRTKIGINF